MEVLEAISKRYSVRGYTAEKLTQKEIEALLTAGLQAPTATNRQEIHFTVIDGGSDIAKEIEAERTGGKPSPVNFYYDAPTVILLSAEAGFGWSEVDAGIAVESISLAAEGMGLGSLIIGCIKGALNGPKKACFAEKLAFPEGYEFKIAIAVGRKNAVKPPHGFDFEKSVSFV